MKEDYLNRIAKKIRNKLIYFIHLELKKKAKSNNYFLINSMTQDEINNKYQKYSDYCIEKTETYSSSEMNNRINNNNYFHVSVTYSSINNNYLMLIDENVDQVIGENNIIGKYYRGNAVKIRSTIKKIKTIKNSINERDINNDINLEKMVIGDKKLKMKKKSSCSSLIINPEMKLNNGNDNSDFDYIDILNSNHNNYKKFINLNVNNEYKKSETNVVNKIKKNKYPKYINIYTTKLKNYCATLKKTRKREINNHKSTKNQKNPKEKPKINVPNFTNKESYTLRYKTENPSISSNNNQNSKSKLRSQTKISHLFKIPEKKYINPKNRAQSIDIFQEIITSSKKIVIQKKMSKKGSPKKISSPKKVLSPKKVSSPKKISSPKKVSSPKKLTSTNKISSPKKGNVSPRKMAHSMRSNNEMYFSNLFQKNNKKEKKNDVGCIKKYISGGILNKRKIFNSNNNNIKTTCKNLPGQIKTLKTNEISNRRPINKRFKRANTGIYSKFRFKNSENKLKKQIFDV